MNNRISVVICTYNRPQKVVELVNQLLKCTPLPLEIIVVDSSDKINSELQQNNKIVYIQSSHKNQPYQRILGANISKSDFLLYLDDDMELLNDLLFEKLSLLVSGKNVVGLALSFNDKYKSSLSEIPKSYSLSFSKGVITIKNWITGYPNLKQGKLGLCGIRGQKPQELAPVEYVSGGAFVAKRNILLVNFNYQLLDLFEEKMGMGEDAIFGYSLSRQGTVLLIPHIYFLHNDQGDSTYSKDKSSYAKRVLFSRLYLSLERNRLANKSLFLAKLHYHWYSLFRVLGLFVNWIKHPVELRKSILIGAISGWGKSFNFKFAKKLERNNYWQAEIHANVDLFSETN